MDRSLKKAKGRDGGKTKIKSAGVVARAAPALLFWRLFPSEATKRKPVLGKKTVILEHGARFGRNFYKLDS